MNCPQRKMVLLVIALSLGSLSFSICCASYYFKYWTAHGDKYCTVYSPNTALPTVTNITQSTETNTATNTLSRNIQGVHKMCIGRVEHRDYTTVKMPKGKMLLLRIWRYWWGMSIQQRVGLWQDAKGGWAGNQLPSPLIGCHEMQISRFWSHQAKISDAVNLLDLTGNSSWLGLEM